MSFLNHKRKALHLNITPNDSPTFNLSPNNNDKLNLSPNFDHEPQNYQECYELGENPLIFRSLERHLRPNMLNVGKEDKLNFMREILAKYNHPNARKQKKYRKNIISNYRPLHKELYTMSPTDVFVPEFVKAIQKNTIKSFKNIINEPKPGIFIFQMFKPRLCELLVEEVENFEKWAHELNLSIMRPTTMNDFGAVLDDFGFESMLGKLMEDFILPISNVFFPEVGGSTLDSHHAFVVKCGMKKDLDLAMHVDDAEVSLNVCLSKKFSGGELYFRGIRCEQHVQTITQPEESFDYSHVLGLAVLHRGRHRHGARATVSGDRINLLLWCRSAVFRETKKSQKDFSKWCGECQHEKRERQPRSILAIKQELLERGAWNEAAT